MKKTMFLGLIAVAATAITSCSDDFAELYPDPSKTSTASCEKLMTGVFYNALTYTKPTRDGIEYYDLTIYGKYAQTAGYVNKGWARRIGGAPDTRWKDYYKMLAQYRMLEETYKGLDEAGKKDNEVFLLLGEVFTYQQTLQMLTLFGDMPFSEAGKLAILGDAVASKPKFDKAEAIYTTILDRLGAINTRLKEIDDAGLSPVTAAYLPKQDYICGGKLPAWRKFANSLRLRAAVHTASNGSLTTKSQGVIKEMLETNPSAYPLVATNDDNIKLPVDKAQFNPQLDESGSHGILNAYGESDGGRNQAASQALLDRLVGDPRLPVMFSPNSYGQYRGMRYDENGDTQDTEWLLGVGKEFAVVDSATFGWNDKYPGLLFTAAEVAFIKAEAYQKGWASGNPEEAFKEAVSLSIDFYFWLNAQSTYRTPETKPNDGDITAFVDGLWLGENNKSLLIATQKWVHFSLIFQLEAWNEVRRTGMPALMCQEYKAANAYSEPPSRFMYPENEFDNNKENYPKDASRVEVTEIRKPLFWAKPDGWFTKIDQVTTN